MKDYKWFQVLKVKFDFFYYLNINFIGGNVMLKKLWTMWEDEQTLWEIVQTLWEGVQTLWERVRTLWDKVQTLWEVV